jgi:hypothetical protein
MSDIGSIPGPPSVLLSTIIWPFRRATKYKRVANAAKTMAHSKCGLTTGRNDILDDWMLPTHKLIQIVKAMWNKNVLMVFEALSTRDRFNTRLREVKLAIGYKQYNSISNVASGRFPEKGVRFVDKYTKGKKYHHMMPSQKKLRLYFDRYGMITATGPTGKSKMFKI